MSSVLQPWVNELNFMMQSVLLSSVRGPDGIEKYSPVKMIIRWYRRCILISAFDQEIINTPVDRRGGSFTGPSAPTPTDGESIDWEHLMEPLLHGFIKSIDTLPHHFTLHLMHASEIIGFYHPDNKIREWWYRFYLLLVDDMHLYPESKEQLDKRLSGVKSDWVARNHSATLA